MPPTSSSMTRLPRSTDSFRVSFNPMQTRRGVLRTLAVAPLIITSDKPRTQRIIAERDCLSEESARGFSLLSLPLRDLIIVCGATRNAATRLKELRERAVQGTWALWEQRPGVDQQVAPALSRAFDLKLGPPFVPGMLIRYNCPKATWTRSFLECTPVEYRDSAVLAYHGATPICLKRNIGCGGIVFLGSMLGPNLWAEEPQAHVIANRILAAL
jgi:hypothetical protein